jgi:hypothetical protein
VAHLWKGSVLGAIAGIEGGAPSVAVYDDPADQKLFYNGERPVPAGLFAALPALWNLSERIDAGEFSAAGKLPSGRTPEETAAEIVSGSIEALDTLMNFLGIENVNAAARRAGMTQTEIAVPAGAADAEKRNLTCASDAAAFFRKLSRGEGISADSRARLIRAFSSCPAKNKFAAPGAPVAHLAFSAPKIEYDAGIFFPDTDHPIVAAALVILLTNREKGLAFCEKTARALTD